MKRTINLILILLTAIPLVARETSDCIGMKCESHFIGNCNNTPISGKCDTSGLIGCIDTQGCSGEFTPTIRNARCVSDNTSDRCQTKQNSLLISSCFKICKRVSYVAMCNCESNGETGNGVGRTYIECINE